MIKIIILCSLAIEIALSMENCDKHGINIYEDMNCKAVEHKNGCPSKYDCQNNVKSDKFCYYKGEKYETGKPFNNSRTFCKVGCFCSGNDKETTKFVCAAFGCGNWGPPPPENCYWKYDLDKCCAAGQNCPSKDSEVFECEYQEQKYKEGERFFPDDSCSVCLCQKGFNGKVEEPFCRRTQCDVEIAFQSEIQKSCAPVFRSGDGLRCCPSEFICPDGKEIVTGSPSSDDQCKFGEITLKVGQEITKEVTDVQTKTIHCKCQLPPLLTCTAKN